MRNFGMWTHTHPHTLIVTPSRTIFGVFANQVLHFQVCVYACLACVSYVASRAKQVEDKDAGHARELLLKDELIQASNKEAKKWQVMSIAASGTDINKFKQFSDILQSPTKGAGSSDS